MSKPNLGPSPAQTQERRSAEIIAFPRPPDGRVSREGLQWYVDHPKEAAAESIAPWQLEAIAYRLRVLDEIAERDRLDPEPVLPRRPTTRSRRRCGGTAGQKLCDT